MTEHLLISNKLQASKQASSVGIKLIVRAHRVA